MPPNAPTPWTAAFGNAAVPQRQEHSQAPAPLRVPEPETIDPELDPEDIDPELELAAEEVTAGGGAATELVDPPVMADADPVPFWAMAICWNMA